MTLKELMIAFEAFPADITFVDADGIVLHYSERYRIFTRKPTDIGRDVVECHSPGVQGRVSRLMDELRDGWRDEAAFLEKKDGRDVHVRYMPLRDPEGTYMGVLEIVQWADEISK